jgi:hypothetical protein
VTLPARRPGTAQRTLTRRGFLGRAAAASGAAAAPWIVPASALGADGAVAASERIGLGIIGLGVMGSGHVRHLAGRGDVQVLAVCDVDRSRRDAAKAIVGEAGAAQRAAGTFRGCEAYNDYREVLARPDIDGVVIVTPDHWHSPLAIEAARAGKDVYCEKPVSLTVSESRRLVGTVRRFGRVFQTGTQYRSIPRIRRVCEFVRGGGLGKVKSVFTIWAKVGGPGGKRDYVPRDPALPEEPVPDGLDWNLWVGPAGWRPYNAAYHRNPPPGVVPWVFCDAFGAGAVTGYHSHAADVIQYALGVETGGPVEIVHPSTGEFPTLTCRYANGTLLHHVEHWGIVKSVYKAVPDSARLAGNFGGLFVGERGWITSMTGGGDIEAAPASLFDEMRLDRVESYANSHHGNWLDCMRTRARPSSHEEIGHRSASLGHLVDLSYRLGRSLKWDPALEVFVGDDTANRLLSRAARAPWRT